MSFSATSHSARPVPRCCSHSSNVWFKRAHPALPLAHSVTAGPSSPCELQRPARYTSDRPPTRRTSNEYLHLHAGRVLHGGRVSAQCNLGRALANPSWAASIAADSAIMRQYNGDRFASHRGIVRTEARGAHLHNVRVSLQGAHLTRASATLRTSATCRTAPSSGSRILTDLGLSDRPSVASCLSPSSIRCAIASLLGCSLGHSMEI